ncbi:acetyl-CoA C-acyltransferase [Acinetobacter sp. WCHAc060042]|uniref:acetyl-CoA C-acyltransferase n=1 Tax=Acinetobacter sp. WCHAc060042 TaxID=2213016 RepID=UPI000DA6CB36|nr:acetyl-CoA C-acyltransferase [Acinetobacter sp. WCHAc060042]
MREAVIVSTARTPIGRAFRGAFNDTKSPTLMGHAIQHAVAKTGLESDIFEDVVVGSVLNAGTAGGNIARMASFAAGLPVTVPGQTIDRQCSSGLMAIATAAKQITFDGMEAVIAGGQENITAVQNPYFEWVGKEFDPNVVKHVKAAYMPMLQTAEYVAKKYGVSREQQDAYSLESQMRTARAQQNGIFDNEIVAIQTKMKVQNKETGELSFKEILLHQDEGNRADTTLAGLSSLKPVIEGGVITGGNASQLSDGASACAIVEAKLAERQGLEPLGVYRGMTVSGCAPEEMGIGPIYAIPKLLKQHGLKIDDIGVWELNEAFACQVLYCRDHLDIDPEKYNINGGSISIGHPYGMTGSRLVGHALLEAKRRKEKYAVVSMCIGGGMGAAALFEVY